jgi:hypothetical protein
MKMSAGLLRKEEATSMETRSLVLAETAKSVHSSDYAVLLAIFLQIRMAVHLSGQEIA